MVTGRALLGLLLLLSAEPRAQEPVDAFEVRSVKVGPASFDPSHGESAVFQVVLSRPAILESAIYDRDLDLIARPAARTTPATEHTLHWDGRDLDGRIVPDEAYFLAFDAIAAGGGERITYDPLTTSGGEPYDLGPIPLDLDGGVLSYRLPQAGRVLARIGIPSGPLIATVVDWEPRPAGSSIEPWRGSLGPVPPQSLGLSSFVSYVTLPDASVIVFGRREPSFAAYKAPLRTVRRRKPSRPMANARRIAPVFHDPGRSDLALVPRLSLAGLPGQAILLIEPGPATRQRLVGRPFEIALYVDLSFVLEEEAGYLPMRLPLDGAGLAAGRHLLTVNVATFEGEIGAASLAFEQGSDGALIPGAATPVPPP